MSDWDFLWGLTGDDLLFAQENGYTKEVGTDISIKNRLFFTAKQWMKYIGNKMDVGSVERRMIEQNLKKYVNRYCQRAISRCQSPKT